MTTVSFELLVALLYARLSAWPLTPGGMGVRVGCRIGALGLAAIGIASALQ